MAKRKKQRPQQQTVIVYFIARKKDGAIKVGITSNLERRFAAIQQGIPDELELLGSFRGTREDERWFKRRFAHFHLRGEWYLPADLGGIGSAVLADDPSLANEHEKADQR